MTGPAVVVALVTTAFLVFVGPYILTLIGAASDGTETLIVVILLWMVTWTVHRMRSTRDGS